MEQIPSPPFSVELKQWTDHTAMDQTVGVLSTGKLALRIKVHNRKLILNRITPPKLVIRFTQAAHFFPLNLNVNLRIIVK